MIRDNRTGRLPVHKTEANYALRSLPVCSRDPDGRRGPRSEQVDQGRCLVACVRHGRPRQRQQVRTVGADPKGIIIFTPDGHFALFQSRAKLPKIASNGRAKATAEEAVAIVAGSIAYFGTYSVDEGERSLSVTLDGSTFPNILAGSVQKRLITSLDTNELKFANPRTPSGMTLQTVWKRAEVR